MKKSESVGPPPFSKEEDLLSAQAKLYSTSFNEEIEELLKTLESYDFIIPIDQIEIINQENDQI